MPAPFAHEFDWTGPSADPNDEQFGDIIESCHPTDLDDYDAVIVGEPYDGAVIGRQGAAEGPQAIRAALAAVKSHHFDSGPLSDLGDLGNLTPLHSATVRETQAAVREATQDIHAAPAFPVFLGGDNSLTYPNAAPLLETGALGCLTVDAHLDVREVRDGATSGTPYRQLFDAGLDAYACLGARHFETTTAYHEYVRAQGGTVVTAEEVGDDPVAAVDHALDAMAGVDHVYVSLDIDVVDASSAPGVSAPTPGGLSTRELFRVLRLVAAADRVAGFEIVECAPPLDRDDRTVAVAARAVAHFLSGLAARGAV